MIHTASYFDKKNHIGEVLAISNTKPGTIAVDDTITELIPQWKLVDQFKKALITWEDYAELYNRQLNAECENSRNNIIAQLNYYSELDVDVTLLCWCGDVEQCHRSLAAAWLRDELGVSVGDIK